MFPFYVKRRLKRKQSNKKWWEFGSSREKFALLSNGESFEKSYCSKHLKQKLRQEERKLNKRKMIALEKGVDLSQAKNYQKQKIKSRKNSRKNSQPTNGYFKQNYNGIGFKLRCYLY